MSGARTIHVGLALAPDEGLRAAALPLLVEGAVDALEWTLDLGFGDAPLPAWVTSLLDAYADAGRLYGHGVSLSPCSAATHPAAAAWLARARAQTRRLRHVTEHWGASRAGPVRSGAPLPVPACTAAVDVVVDHLRELASAVDAPVGLENLALSFSADGIDAQAAMLTAALDAVDGVLLLDLHNAWCQAVNFGRDVRDVLAAYPLARVRQLHLAGGTWSTSRAAPGAPPFRRDTHDADVPDEVLALLPWIVPRCPNLEVVILERLPGTLDDPEAARGWQAQWRTLADLVRRAAALPLIATPMAALPPLAPARVDELAAYQAALVTVLAAAPDAHAAHQALRRHPATAPFAAEVARFEPRALEVAQALLARWSLPAFG